MQARHAEHEAKQAERHAEHEAKQAEQRAHATEVALEMARYDKGGFFVKGRSPTSPLLTPASQPQTPTTPHAAQACPCPSAAFSPTSVCSWLMHCNGLCCAPCAAPQMMGG